jgi:tetratricopeptide (TPR) repeat protein
MKLSNPISLLRVLVFVLTLAASVAHADALHPASLDATKHLDAGKNYFRNRDFKQAVEEFKAGALIERAPIFDLNLAQAYRELGDYKAAIWHYRQFLREYTIADDYIDGAKEKLSEAERLLAQQDALSAQEPKASTPVSPTPRPQVATERWYHDWFGWSVTGVGVAAAVTGVLFLNNASDINDQANRTSNQQDSAALHDRADTRSLIGDAFLIAGAAAAVTGIIKLAVPPSEPPADVAHWSIGVSPTGVVVFGQF